MTLCNATVYMLNRRTWLRIDPARERICHTTQQYDCITYERSTNRLTIQLVRRIKKNVLNTVFVLIVQAGPSAWYCIQSYRVYPLKRHGFVCIRSICIQIQIEWDITILNLSFSILFKSRNKFRRHWGGRFNFMCTFPYGKVFF